MTTKKTKAVEKKARTGEHTGKFAVFCGISGNQKAYVAIAQLGKLLADSDYTYDHAPLLAFQRQGGSLLLDVSHLQPADEPEDGLDLAMNTLAVFESCPDAYVYANGLLSEGRRWRAAA